MLLVFVTADTTQLLILGELKNLQSWKVRDKLVVPVKLGTSTPGANVRFTHP